MLDLADDVLNEDGDMDKDSAGGDERTNSKTPSGCVTNSQALTNKSEGGRTADSLERGRKQA